MKTIFSSFIFAIASVASHAGTLENYRFNAKYVAPLKFDVQQAVKIIKNATASQQGVQTVLNQHTHKTLYATPFQNQDTNMLEQFALSEQRSSKTGKVQHYVLSHNDVLCGNLARTTSSALRMNPDQSFNTLFESYLGARVYDDLPCKYQGNYASAPPAWTKLLTLDTKKVDEFLQYERRSIIRFKPFHGVSLLSDKPSHKVFAYERRLQDDGTVHYVVLDRYFVCTGMENVYVMLIFKQDGSFYAFKEGNSFQNLITEPLCRAEAKAS